MTPCKFPQIFAFIFHEKSYLMSYPLTPFFTTIDQSEDTNPYISPIPTQFPLYAYFLPDFDMKLAVFSEYFKFPCNTLCFWINFLDNNQDKKINLEPDHPNFLTFSKFLQNTNEKFLEGEFDLYFFLKKHIYLFFP